MRDVLVTAVEMHQTGQWARAAQLYLRVLQSEQENADALHLLGVLKHQQGNHAEAVALISRAVALRPGVPDFHANLAEAFRALGQLDRAAGGCQAALRLRPDHPEALCNLGMALQGLGRHDEAIASFRLALERRPDFAVVHNNLGVSLREQGQPDEALAHFRRAVELAPAHAAAHTNLGQMLLDRGEAEEALRHCQEAVRLQPDLAALHHNLGNVLHRLGRLVDARAAYLEALRLAPTLARSHAHLGVVLRQEGRLDEALPWLEQAVVLEPGNPTFWEWLGELHVERESPADAIPCWRQVLALAPEKATAHIYLGLSLHEEGQLAEAGQHYRQAVRSLPGSAAARLNLGWLHEELGELNEAEAAFREALRLQPGYALPHARLATLLRGKLPEADLAALEDRLTDPQLGPGVRARLLFGLAHVLDARGDFAGAADCLRQANALTRELARGRRDYFPAEHEQFVDGLTRVFDPALFERLAAAGSQSRRPVFIFGLPRSGTTLVEQVLASHPRIHAAGELRLARQSFEAIPVVLGRDQAPLACVKDMDAAALQHLAGRHLEALRALAGDAAERVVDKMPDNYLYVGLLALLFPRAVFIHCRRGLRDGAVSCWMTDFRSLRWSNDFQHIASRFRQYRRVMNHWHSVLPVTVHEVDYEDTVTDLEGTARRLLAACEQEWDPACLEFHRTQRPVRTASVTQVRQPIYRRSLARWKNYERELGELFAALPM
jgi:tetratricopeptide (TPR) repeat protein